jgi:hypothetical protein
MQQSQHCSIVLQSDQIDLATPYFGLEHLPRKSIALSDWGNASEMRSTKLAFKEGEILFEKIRPIFIRTNVGQSTNIYMIHIMGLVKASMLCE